MHYFVFYIIIEKSSVLIGGQVMKRIDAIYQKVLEIGMDKGCSATDISEALGITRANASSDLNRLCEEQKLKKLDGRPVLFQINEINFDKQNNSGDQKNFIGLKHTLDLYMEKNPSLFNVAEQAKAAVLYPPKGMHMLILGETGVGKTMLAALIHQYAIEIKIMQENSPFIHFNCADYANNPQLLLSQIFGSKKGAYTGASEDRIGLVEKANNGILFLDEVHRLPPEGQELFFTLMDKGEFRRLGETSTLRKAQVLIISATTENPNSVLLQTFKRRIPMTITIPNLRDRTVEERFNLIKTFLSEESRRLDNKLYVSVNTVKALSGYTCPNNIGQLKSDIQMICAKAYADYISGSKDRIEISSLNAPKHIRDGLYNEIKHRQLWNKLIGINSRFIIIDGKNQDVTLLIQDEDIDNIYEHIDLRVRELKFKGINDDELEDVIGHDIDDYFAKYIDDSKATSNLNVLENLVGEEIIKVVHEIIDFAENKLNRKFSNKIYLGMAVHISNTLKRLQSNNIIVNPKLNKIRLEHPNEFKVAVSCTRIIERLLDITIPLDEAGFIAMFFVFNEQPIAKTVAKVKVITIAHGSSTATSMAETANRLIGQNFAHGINANLDENPQTILDNLIDFLRRSNTNDDILLLVDMGTLNNFGNEITRQLKLRTRTIPLVSTLHVIEAARKASLGFDLDDIYQTTLKVFTLAEPLMNTSVFLDTSEPINQNKTLILTICTTGAGSAEAFKQIIETNLVFDSELFEIRPIRIVGESNIYERIENISKTNKILCIVSSFELITDIPQMPLVDIISGKIDALQHMVDLETVILNLGDILDKQLTNISGTETVPEIKHFIHETEILLNFKIETEELIGVILHIGYSIDALKSGKSLESFPEKAQYISKNPLLYQSIRYQGEILYSKYNLKLDEDEICYLMMFFDEERRKPT